MQTAWTVDKRYHNWTKDSLCLLYLTEGLRVFVDQQSDAFHRHLKAVIGDHTCTCTWQALTRDKRTWTVEKCPSGTCQSWLDLIVSHSRDRPFPMLTPNNTKPALWPVDSWEIMKLYQPMGCRDQHSAKEADMVGILRILNSCDHFWPFISNLNDVNDLLDLRNRLMHNPTLRVETQDMTNDLQLMLQFLRGLKSLSRAENQPVQEAIAKIEQLWSKTNGELELAAFRSEMEVIETESRNLDQAFDDIKQISNIPDGFYTLDPKWTELYLQTLREGKEKQRDVRLMIVGHEGVGKTTLVRNLMNIPIQDVETTNGIEVHVRTGSVEVDGTWKESETRIKDAEVGERIARIIEPVNKKAELAQTGSMQTETYTSQSNSSSADAETSALSRDVENALNTESSIPHEVKKKDLSISGQTNVKQILMAKQMQHNTNLNNTVSVWDFGGQFVFYATHQIFHSPGAIYLLVLDLSKGFNDIINDGCPMTCSGARGKTVKDFIKFWLHSIHTFACSQIGEPPVILVGTHRDKIDGQGKEAHAEKYFENVRKMFDETPLLHHIQRLDFFLDNVGPEKNSFDKLRVSIMETAANQTSFNKEIPAKWIPLEQALLQIENKPYITFSEVREMDSKNDVPIANVDVIRLFLMHHHFQGHLVYFYEEELQDYVILKPQWIIDAFKCIITSWRVFCKDPNLREKWQEFENTAVLKHSLIEEVWKNNDETDFLADSELLIKFLVRLGIMSRGWTYDEGTGQVEELDYFLVPSLLPEGNECDMETFLGKATSTQMSIVFKFENSYISPTIYHRITAAAIGKWGVEHGRGARLLNGNFGVYRLPNTAHRHHVGVIRHTGKAMELSVHNLCRKSVSGDIADNFRRFITKAINQELNRALSGIETKITTAFRCSKCSKQGTEEEHIATEELKHDDSLPCPVTLSGHIINGTEAYREWFEDADIFIERDRQVLQIRLGDKELGKISKAIGLNWELLGMNLGIPLVEIERIKMDNPFSSAVQILKMLQSWKERTGVNATMQALIEKMQGDSRVSIDWDQIKDVIDSLSQR